jgi:hypothetical protein
VTEQTGFVKYPAFNQARALMHRARLQAVIHKVSLPAKQEDQAASSSD